MLPFLESIWFDMQSLRIKDVLYTFLFIIYKKYNNVRLNSRDKS